MTKIIIMTFINKGLKSRIGSKAIFDPTTKLNIQLPNGYKTFNRKPDTWIGGAEDGEVIVHVERLKGDPTEITTILAEGDLDLNLCSEGSIDHRIQGIKVNGSASNLGIQGYLGMVEIVGKVAYLVLAASHAIGKQIDLKGLSLDIMSRIHRSIKS